MPVEITIKGVSEEVRDNLAVKAAAQEKSLQEFLHGELERIASRPSNKEWMEEVRRRKSADPKTVPAKVILQALREDRK